MKRAILFLTVILFIGLTALYAQGRMTREERVKQYKERLKLTDAQTKKLDAILAASELKIQKLRDSGDMENMRDEMMKMRNESNDEIQKILKPDQKKEFLKMMEERKNRGQGQGRNRQ